MRINITTEKGVIEENEGDELLMQGTASYVHPFNERWEDLQGSVHGQTGTGKSDMTYESFRDTGFNIYCFQHNQNDQYNIVYQMPHGWDTSSSVEPHMHLVPLASCSNKIAYFEISYAWNHVGEAIPISSSWTVQNTSYNVSGAMLYIQHPVSLGLISPPAAAKASSLLFIKTRRLGTSDNDTYTESKDHGTPEANLGILYADLHYRKLRAGTKIRYGND